MSGPTTPQLIVTPFAVSGGKNVIPVASSATPGAASYTDGFPPATRTSPSSGGVPPFGLDMNGILYALSTYAAWMQGGMGFPCKSTYATSPGYAVGAVVASTVAGKFFRNTVDGNTNDPDVTPTGWLAFIPSSVAANYQVAAPAAGTFNDVALNTGVGILDVTPTGTALYTGFAGGVDGQILVVSNLAAAQTLTLRSLTGSAAGNQLRLAADLTLLTRQSQAFRYTVGPATAVWVPL